VRPILALPLNSELDVIASRLRARQVALICGFATQDQARIATAVSELARNLINNASGGQVRFALSAADARQFLVVEVEDRRTGIAELQPVLPGTHRSSTGSAIGILAARRFMDACEIDTGSEGTTIVLHKFLPSQAPYLSPADIESAVAQLEALPSNVALSEANHQNRELTEALAALQLKQAELIDVSTQLEETNHQVEALNHLLNEKAETLVSADHRKDQFLSVLSHELRGPLSAASMAAHVLEKTPGATEQTIKLSRIINRQISHMSRLVEDLLDVSRVSRGLVSIDKSPVDLRDVITACIEQTMPDAVRKNHQVDVSLPEAACVINGDRTRLIQVVCNIMGNAIRYTPDGGNIRVTVAVVAAGYSVRVSDDGIGIPAHIMPKLFDLYVQAEHTSERVGGLGLGLALVKSLVELHAGTVTVSSQGEGCGSTFEILFPI
jgi:signal transduction histidine kinase